jgi:hypothetical protein
MAAIVRNVQNDDLYEFLGEKKFKNIRTGKEGIVEDEMAQKIFKINLEATQLISEYPVVSELIHSLHLKFDNNIK